MLVMASARRERHRATVRRTLFDAVVEVRQAVGPHPFLRRPTGSAADTLQAREHGYGVVARADARDLDEVVPEPSSGIGRVDVGAQVDERSRIGVVSDEDARRDREVARNAAGRDRDLGLLPADESAAEVTHLDLVETDGL
jgi:hypothetical protein